MKKLLTSFAVLALASIFCAPPAHACSVAWGQLIVTEAENRACIRDFAAAGDRSHFEQSWRTDGWSGEGYMRWRINQTMPEDDDGYWISHPTTATRSIYLSFVARVGSTWWQHHTQRGQFKFAMFYPTANMNPRPTIFNMPIRDSGGTYRYRTFAPDVAAGGQGCDQFGNCNHDQGDGYPNHTYKEGPQGHNQWYFIVVSLEHDRSKTYIWSQDGNMSGFYAQSQLAEGATLSSWNAQTWRSVRLLAYVLETTAGDANAYMDIGHIRVTQSLPTPPAGFVTGETAATPNPPSNVIVE